MPECVNGSCRVTPKVDGSVCVDVYPETVNDKCFKGDCMGRPDPCVGLQCVRRGECQTHAECRDGECFFTHEADGVECHGKDSGVFEERCAGGGCVGTGRISCGETECVPLRAECLSTRCLDHRCVLTLLDDCSPCDVLNPFATQKVCRGGACVAAGARGGSQQLNLTLAAVQHPKDRTISAMDAASAEGRTIELVLRDSSFQPNLQGRNLAADVR